MPARPASLSARSARPPAHRPQGERRRALAERCQEVLALNRRLLLQLRRRPSSLVVGVIQPLLWLVLFGALFARAPQGFLPEGADYGRFLTAGVIVFTAFNGALNAGLPVMFDREFGFLNRLLVAPLRSRSSIVLASVLHIAAVSLIQSLVILVAAALLGHGLPSGFGLVTALLALSLLTVAVTGLSLALAFSLPGHVELLAVTVLINLPLLFSSTALAPLSFMPPVLRWLACLNPLTYAIEPVRAAYLGAGGLGDVVLQAPYGAVTTAGCLWMLLVLSAAVLALIRPLLNRRLG